MSEKKPYVGDIGTDLVVDVTEDLTGATVGLSVRKPSGITVVWQAVVHESRSVRHTVAAGDFNEAGVYRVQPVISLADGTWSGRGKTAELRVYGKHQ
mgnify:CR=1 FL=1